jgi:hypothetical protein
MGRPKTLLAVCGAAVLAFATAAAADSNWVRGTVKAVSADSVTVTVQGKDMTFKVDKATDLVGPGLGTKTREAKAAGQAGLAITQAMKAGDRVEVHYAAATMMAEEIRTGVSAPEGMSGAAAPPATEHQGKSVRGTVTAVGPASITVKGDAEWTIAVDAKTRIVGSGLGTAARQAEAAGKSTGIAEFVKVGDRVVVSIEDAAGKKRASEVRVVGK